MKKNLFAAALFAASSLVAVSTASASVVTDFTGPFNVSNWTTTLNGTPAGGGAPAAVNTGGAPASVQLIGGDTDCLIGPCTTDFTIAMPNGFHKLWFHWDYQTNDVDGPGFDIFGYLINGVFTALSDLGGPVVQSGDVFINGLAPGDVFGFRIDCTDCVAGGATATVSQFRAAPEPGTLAILGLGLAGLAAARRRRVTA